MAPFQDRLSTLPDELVFHIISSLPFKEAVRTAVLGPRWRFLAPGIKNMEFRERQFVTAQENPTRENQRRDFVAFVLRWIIRAHPGSWKMFSLAVSDPQDFQVQLQQCIRFAISRNVEVFNVDFSNPEWDEADVENYYNRVQTAVQLPLLRDGDLRALKTMKLSSCYFSPGSVFSGLRSVALRWISVGQAGMRGMLEKCAFLETLSMKNCCYVSENVEIISESLRSVVMENCRSADGPESWLYLTVDAPEMKRFVYSGVLFTLHCESLNLDLEATLDLGIEGQFGEFGDVLYGVLHGFGGVRTLTVCTYMLQVIPHGEEPTSMKPKLERLNYLTLKASLSRDEFYGITFFLKSCPNLEVLTIDLNSAPRVFEDYEPPAEIQGHPFFRYMSIVFPCLKKKLRRIVVEGFRGTNDEMLVLRYLLEYSKVLTTLEVTISKERDADGNSLEEVYVDRVFSLFKQKVANKKYIELLINRN